MTRSIFLVVSFLICIQLAFASDADNLTWDFFGIRLGESQKSVISMFPEFKCGPDRKITFCKAYFRFGDEHSRSGVLSGGGGTDVTLVFDNDKLANIKVLWFPDAFDTTYAELKAAYGEPHQEDKNEILAENGQTIKNHTIIWHNGVSTIIFNKYSSSGKRSDILYMLK